MISFSPCRLTSSHILGLTLCAVLTLTGTGCLAIAAAALTGTVVAYEKGDTEANIQATQQEIAVAAENVLKSNGYALLDPEMDGKQKIVRARTPSDKLIRVGIEPVDDKPSVQHVSVRVGSFGDSAIGGNVMAGIVEQFED